MVKNETVKFNGWEDWLNLYEKYEHADFNDATQRKAFRDDFTSLSQAWFCKFGVNEDELADIWTNPNMLKERMNDSIEDIYSDALSYLEYASDRMNYNRWLYIKLRLNCDVR